MITNHDQRPDAGRLPTHSESLSAPEAFPATRLPGSILPAPAGPSGAATGRPGINRRHVLTAGAAIAAVGGAVPVALADAGEPDATLVAFWRRRKSLRAESDRVYAHVEALERQYPQFSLGHQIRVHVLTFVDAAPARRGETEPVYAYTEDEIREMRKPWTDHIGSTADKAKARRRQDDMIAELKDKRRRWNAGRDRVGITAVNERLEKIDEARRDVEDRIIAAPAAGLAGVAIKLSLGVERLDGDDDWPNPIFLAAQKDAARLVEGVSA